MPDCRPLPQARRESGDGRLLPVHGRRPRAEPRRFDLRGRGRVRVGRDAERRARRQVEAGVRADGKNRHEQADASAAAQSRPMDAPRVAHAAGQPRVPLRLRVLLHRRDARPHDAVQEARIDRRRARAYLPARSAGQDCAASHLLRRRPHLRQPERIQGDLPRHHQAEQEISELQCVVRLAAHHQRHERQGRAEPDARSRLLQRLHRPREHERRRAALVQEVPQRRVRLRRSGGTDARVRHGGDCQLHLRHRRRDDGLF